MRITEIDHRPCEFFKDGLQPLHIHSLRRIVIIAGPNGAGKTRLLERILRLRNSYTDMNGNLSILTLLDQGPAPGIRRISREEFIREGGIHLSYFNHRLSTHINGAVHPESVGVFADAGSPTTEQMSQFSIVPLVSKQLPGLRDPLAISPGDMVNRGQSAEDCGIGQLSDSALSYIQMLQNHEWEVTHPRNTFSEEDKATASRRYGELCKLVKVALEADLGRNQNGHATLFGKPIAQANLSEGQQSLLLWAVALHAQGLKFNDVIITMDEPENHLHPEAMIGSLRRIIEANVNGQLWIATHSVPLIASLYQSYPDDVTLVFMDQGKAAYAGRDPEKVLESLMGGAENIESLREFIDLPEQLAANRFAANCLFPPDTKEDANAGDPQVKLAERALFPANPPTPIKVLDFGAGHGRLLEGLAAGSDGNLASRLDYVAYDRQRSARCVTAIERVYGSGSGEVRSFTDLDSLAAKREQRSFDAVVMCNVLHEIDPGSWLGLFGTTEIPAWALKPSGSLVIIEDYLMPKGEYAHPYGFTVLDTAALKALFGGCSLDVISATGKHSGRIKAHVIPCSALVNVTDETRKAALKQAQAKASERIRALRGRSDKSFRSGQEHAFWVQQFANTTLALDSFGR